MYKVLTSLWSKPPLLISAQGKTRLSSSNSSDASIDEDTWVIVTDTVLVSKVGSSVLNSDNNDNNSIMTTSWIASPPFIRTDQSPSINRSPTTHHFNPIENLLIEHASMSVYEQIASRTRARRHRKPPNDNKLDEQAEEIEDDDNDDEDDDRSSVVLPYPSQHANLSSIQYRNASLSHSINSSISALESSTSSLVAHQRHLHRIHQRRRRSTKTSSKLLLANQIDESKLSSNKLIERQRLNHARTPKLVLQQPCRLNH